MTGSPARPFTPATLAEHWGCSSVHVYNLLSSGALPSFRLGRLWRIRAADVEAYEAGSAAQATGEVDGSPAALQAAPTGIVDAARDRQEMNRIARMVRLTGGG